jgi:rhodanese-related sulfurtransferase
MMESRSLKQIAVAWLLGAALLGCSKPEVESVSSDAAAEMFAQRQAVIVDVREQQEWDEARIEGAIHLPLGQLSSRLQELEPYRNTTLIVQCRSGRRSAEAIHIIKAAGFDQLYNLEGGIQSWVESGHKTVTTAM